MLHKYRLLKSSWGIAIDIDFDIINYVEPDAHKITDMTYLRIKEENLEEEIVKALILGIKDISTQLDNKDESKTIVINKVIYNYAHFQIEGIYCAIQEGICKHIGISPPKVDVIFDKTKNKYIFSGIIN